MEGFDDNEPEPLPMTVRAEVEREAQEAGRRDAAVGRLGGRPPARR